MKTTEEANMVAWATALVVDDIGWFNSDIGQQSEADCSCREVNFCV